MERLKLLLLIWPAIFLPAVPAFGAEICSKAELQEKLNYFSERVRPDFLEQDSEFQSLKLDFDKYWAQCQKKMGEKAWNCFDNMQGFFNTYSGIGTNSGTLGLKISDPEYFHKLSKRKKQLFELPQNFFKDNKLPSDWRDRLDSCIRYYSSLECKEILAWKWIEFESFCSTKFQKNLKQVIFFFPKKDFDQWVLFRWDTPMQKMGVSLPAQIIAVEKVESGNSPRNVYYGELRNYGLDPQVTVSCLKCHTNGPLPVIPMYGSIKSSKPLERMAEFNDVISKYGRINVPYLETKYRGPELGKSVGCTDCHTASRDIASSRGPFYFLSPSIRDALVTRNDHPSSVHEKSVHWKDALSKAYTLSDSKLEKFRTLFGGEECSTKAALNTNKAIQDALRFLWASYKLSDKEFKKAKSSVMDSHDFGNHIYQNLEVEAFEAYKTWLRGGKENCITEVPPASKVD